MNFMEKMEKTLGNEFNYSTTENGALGFRTTGKELVDMNFAVASLRNKSEEEIIRQFQKVFYENKELAVKWMFYVRDIREGLGERRLFKILIKYMSINYPDFMEKLIQFIPEFGRWDDMWTILDLSGDKTCKTEVYRLVKKQFEQDVDNMNNGESISLLAKWLPSINTSSKDTRILAKKIACHLGLNERMYRKLVSKMRNHLNIVERDMSSREWGKIKYESVPSKANLIYKDAFMRHDSERRQSYLDALEKGETKINSSVSFPHEIVHKYIGFSLRGLKPKDQTLEEMWKSLPDLVRESNNTIVVADGSGSMGISVDKNSSVTALEVANSLAIYFAERSSGEFKNKYITFSERPQLVDFSNCETLRDKIGKALAHNEVANTNIEAVFSLILTTAKRENTKQEDIPKNVLIISDMEFDAAQDWQSPLNERLFETIKNRYEKAGYKLPRLIFWNVNSRTNTIPVKENELGVALVSGFSTNIVKMVLSGETDPYQLLVKELMSERYKDIVI